MKQTMLTHRAKGAQFGLAVGDALGTTLEFQPRPDEPVIKSMVGGGAFNLRAGEWTDDTSMRYHELVCCHVDFMDKHLIQGSVTLGF